MPFNFNAFWDQPMPPPEGPLRPQDSAWLMKNPNATRRQWSDYLRGAGRTLTDQEWGNKVVAMNVPAPQVQPAAQSVPVSEQLTRAASTPTSSSIYGIPNEISPQEKAIYEQIVRGLPPDISLRWGYLNAPHGIEGGAQPYPQAVFVKGNEGLPFNIRVEREAGLRGPVISVSFGPQIKSQRDILQPVLFINASEQGYGLSSRESKSSIEQAVSLITSSLDLSQPRGRDETPIDVARRNLQEMKFATPWQATNPRAADYEAASQIGLQINWHGTDPLYPDTAKRIFSSIQSSISAGAYPSLAGGIIDTLKGGRGPLSAVVRLPGGGVSYGPSGEETYSPVGAGKEAKLRAKITGVSPGVTPATIVNGLITPLPSSAPGTGYWTKSQDISGRNAFRRFGVFVPVLAGEAYGIGENPMPQGTILTVPAQYKTELPGNLNDLIENLGRVRNVTGMEISPGRPVGLLSYKGQELPLEMEYIEGEDEFKASLARGQKARGRTAYIAIPWNMTQEGTYAPFLGTEATGRESEFGNPVFTTEGVAPALATKTGLPVVRHPGITRPTLFVLADIEDISGKETGAIKRSIFELGGAGRVSARIGEKALQLPEHVVVGGDVKTADVAQSFINAQSAEGVRYLFGEWAEKTGTAAARNLVSWVGETYPEKEAGWLGLDAERIAAKYTELTEGKWTGAGNQLYTDILQKVVAEAGPQKALEVYEKTGLAYASSSVTFPASEDTRAWLLDQAKEAIRSSPEGKGLSEAEIETRAGANVSVSGQSATLSRKTWIGPYIANEGAEWIGNQEQARGNLEFLRAAEGLFGKETAATLGLGPEAFANRSSLRRAQAELYSTYANTIGGTIPGNAFSIERQRASDISSFLQTHAAASSGFLLSGLEKVMGLDKKQIGQLNIGGQVLPTPEVIEEMRHKDPLNLKPDTFVRSYLGSLSELTSNVLYGPGVVEGAGAHEKFVQDIEPKLRELVKNITSVDMEGGVFGKYVGNPALGINQAWVPPSLRERFLRAKGFSEEEMPKALKDWNKLARRGALGLIAQRTPAQGGAQGVAPLRVISDAEHALQLGEGLKGRRALRGLEASPETRDILHVAPMLGQGKLKGDFDYDMLVSKLVGAARKAGQFVKTAAGNFFDKVKELTYGGFRASEATAMTPSMAALTSPSVMPDLLGEVDPVTKVLSKQGPRPTREQARSFSVYDEAKSSAMTQSYNMGKRLLYEAGVRATGEAGLSQPGLDLLNMGAQTKGPNVYQLISSSTVDKTGRFSSYLKGRGEEGETAFLSMPKMIPETIYKGGAYEYLKSAIDLSTRPMINEKGVSAYPLTAEMAANIFAGPENESALLSALREVGPEQYGRTIQDFYSGMISSKYQNDVSSKEAQQQLRARDVAVLETPFMKASIAYMATKKAPEDKERGESFLAGRQDLMEKLGPEYTSKVQAIGEKARETMRQASGITALALRKALEISPDPLLSAALASVLPASVSAAPEDTVASLKTKLTATFIPGTDIIDPGKIEESQKLNLQLEAAIGRQRQAATAVTGTPQKVTEHPTKTPEQTKREADLRMMAGAASGLATPRQKAAIARGGEFDAVGPIASSGSGSNWRGGGEGWWRRGGTKGGGWTSGWGGWGGGGGGGGGDSPGGPEDDNEFSGGRRWKRQVSGQLSDEQKRAIVNRIGGGIERWAPQIIEAYEETSSRLEGMPELPAGESFFMRHMAAMRSPEYVKWLQQSGYIPALKAGGKIANWLARAQSYSSVAGASPRAVENILSASGAQTFREMAGFDVSDALPSRGRAGRGAGKEYQLPIEETQKYQDLLDKQAVMLDKASGSIENMTKVERKRFEEVGRQLQLEEVRGAKRVAANVLAEYQEQRVRGIVSEDVLTRAPKARAALERLTVQEAELEQGPPEGKATGFFRRLLGGWGIMYMQRIAGYLGQGVGYGVQEAQQLEQVAGVAGARQLGIRQLPYNQQQILQNQMALAGANYNPITAAAVLRAQQPLINDVYNTTVAGLGAYSGMQFLAMSAKAGGAAAAFFGAAALPVAGAVALGSLALTGWSKAQDPASLAYRTVFGGGPDIIGGITDMIARGQINKGGAPVDETGQITASKPAMGISQAFVWGGLTGGGGQRGGVPALTGGPPTQEQLVFSQNVFWQKKVQAAIEAAKKQKDAITTGQLMASLPQAGQLVAYKSLVDQIITDPATGKATGITAEAASRAVSYLVNANITPNVENAKPIAIDYQLGINTPDLAALMLASAGVSPGAMVSTTGALGVTTLLGKVTEDLLKTPRTAAQAAAIQGGVAAMQELGAAAYYLPGQAELRRGDASRLAKTAEYMEQLQYNAPAWAIYQARVSAATAGRRPPPGPETMGTMVRQRAEDYGRWTEQFVPTTYTPEQQATLTQQAQAQQAQDDYRTNIGMQFQQQAYQFNRPALGDRIAAQFAPGGIIPKGQEWFYKQLYAGNQMTMATLAARGGLTPAMAAATYKLGTGETPLTFQQYTAGVDISMQTGLPTGLAYGTTSLANAIQAPAGTTPQQMQAMTQASAEAAARRIYGENWQKTAGLAAPSIQRAITGQPLPSGQMVYGQQSFQYDQIMNSYNQSMASAGLAMKGVSLNLAFTTGVGLNKYAGTINPQTGQPFGALYEGGAWGLQDAQRNLGYQQQEWQFGFQQRGMNLGAQQFRENMALNQRGTQMQRGWTQQDWGYQTQTRELQWGWRQEDYAENIRFMTGRDRRLAERQMGRETIMHDLEGEQIDKQKSRQKELWKLEDQRFALQNKQFQENLKMQQEQLNKSIEYYQQNKELQEEQTKLERAQYIQQMELQKEAAGLQAYYATLAKDNAVDQLQWTMDQAKTQGDANKLAEDALLDWMQAMANAVPIIKSMIDQLLRIPGVTTGSDTDQPPCFIAGTPITMADGSNKTIEKIQVRDLVLSMNIKTREPVFTEVCKVFYHTAEENCGYITVNKQLGVTAGHPMSINGEWAHAKTLRLGDMLLDKDGKDVVVTDLSWNGEQVPSYNFETDDETHNYFAGGVLVHNLQAMKAAGGILRGLASGAVEVGEQGTEGIVGGRVIPHSEWESLKRIHNLFQRPVGVTIAGGASYIPMGGKKAGAPQIVNIYIGNEKLSSFVLDAVTKELRS